MGYFDMLFGHEWELTKSPAGAWQWRPKDEADKHLAPSAHNPSKRVPTMMSTADMAMRMDPIYEPIARRFHENPEEFADAFARAWFKLTHRDMGPRSRYLGAEVPTEELIWQDPVPAVDHDLIDAADIAELKAKILASRLPIRHSSRPPGRRPQPSAAPTNAAGRTGRASVSRRKRIGKSTSRPS